MSLFINNINSLKDLLLVFLTVALFYLAFPSGGYGFTAWFALIAVIISFYQKTPRQAFMLGLLAGTLGWMVSIWWVVGGLANITGSPFNVVIPFVFIFCLFSALPYALVSWLHSRYTWGTSIAGTFKSSILITVLINFIPHLLPGNLAHALYLHTEQIQLAAIGGVALIFFVIHWVNFLLAAAFITYRAKQQTPWRFIALALMLLGGNYLYGLYAIGNVSEQVESSQQPSLTIAMVQPNFPVNWRSRDDWLQHYHQLTDLLNKVSHNEQTQLVVLPEIPVPISYQKFSSDHAIFDRARNNKAMLLTSIDFTGEHLSEQQGYYNGIEFVQTKDPVQQYHKQFLLPFGEYLPFEDQLPFLRQLFPHAPKYKAGSSTKLLSLTLENHHIKIMPLICYEAVFTQLVAKGVNQGSDILINTVDDAWFGDTAGLQIHFALALFRSIEFRQPLVRVTNSGYSAIVDATGTVIENSKITPQQTGTSITTVHLAKINSIYQKYPYWFMIFCLIITSYILITDEKRLSAVKRGSK